MPPRWQDLIKALMVCVLIACGAQARQRTQTTLTSIAQFALVIPQDARTYYHEQRDAHCRREHPPASSVYADWHECMGPSWKLDKAVGTLEATLRAAQDAFDASGQDGLIPMLPMLRDAVANAMQAYTETGLPVPGVVLDLKGLIDGE